MGELVEESPQDHKITEMQVLRLVQLPRTAEPIHSLSKLEIVFNFRMWNSTFGWRHATIACYSSATRLQWLHHSINHTPLLAAQANGRVNF